MTVVRGKVQKEKGIYKRLRGRIEFMVANSSAWKVQNVAKGGE